MSLVRVVHISVKAHQSLLERGQRPTFSGFSVRLLVHSRVRMTVVQMNRTKRANPTKPSKCEHTLTSMGGAFVYFWPVHSIYYCIFNIFLALFPRKPQLLQGVYAMGFNRPSKIQETALPMMLAEP